MIRSTPPRSSTCCSSSKLRTSISIFRSFPFALQYSLARVIALSMPPAKSTWLSFSRINVEQADTVIHPSADFHSHLFKDTHTRSGFTRIKHAGVGSFQALHVTAGHGSDTAHALHDVQHQTFGLQQ